MVWEAVRKRKDRENRRKGGREREREGGRGRERWKVKREGTNGETQKRRLAYGSVATRKESPKRFVHEQATTS